MPKSILGRKRTKKTKEFPFTKEDLGKEQKELMVALMEEAGIEITDGMLRLDMLKAIVKEAELSADNFDSVDDLLSAATDVLLEKGKDDEDDAEDDDDSADSGDDDEDEDEDADDDDSDDDEDEDSDDDAGDSDDDDDADEDDDDESDDADDDDEDDDDDDDADDDEDTPKSKSGLKSALLTGKRMTKEMKREQTRKRGGTPTVFFRDGDEKILRFRDESPLASVYMHLIEHSAGKWSRHVCSDSAGVPCEYCRAGNNPQLTVIYEVIDRTGFKNKKGEKIKNRACFFETTTKRHQQLEKLSAKVGLTTRDVEVGRMGDRQDTTYSFVPLEKSSSVKDKKIARLSKDLDKYYAVESPKEQRRVLGV